MHRVCRMSGRAAGPTIGVTFSSRATEKQRQSYMSALEEHGARAVALRPGGQRQRADEVHGLLLSGGGDIHPKYYGEKARARLSGVDCRRDGWELLLARGALKAGMPVLGICRGAQVLGVALDGRLVQDIASEKPEALAHRANGPGRDARHWIRIAEGTRLGEIMGAGRVRVNSSHHQANAALGEGTRAVAWSGDGVIEGIEGLGAPFVLGVQWHPERMWWRSGRSPRQRRVFAAFVGAAQDYAGGERGSRGGS